MTETLIVDDDAGIRFFLMEVLTKAGYHVLAVERGEAALEIVRETRFDLVFLDLNLGGNTDGLQVLEMLRWRWPDTAIVILTAYGSMDSALAAIREGVDGYLLKPVDPQDIRQAAEQALVRRKQLPDRETQQTGTSILRHGKILLDLNKHRTLVDGQPIDLTASEFQLLVHFVRNNWRVSTPVELVKVARGYDCSDEREAREIIKWYIYRLRRKIGHKPDHPEYISNIRGVGYRLGELE